MTDIIGSKIPKIGQGNSLKKAMSLVELVFVVIIIGILSAVLAPSFQRESTRQAANQILAHIRYTQHLALIDNKFSNTDPNWYKKRWQIQFNHKKGSWRYVIYSDLSLSGNANSKKEVARNPSNPNEYLIGWENNSSINPTKKLDIGKSFGIKNNNNGVVFSGGCARARRLSFDNLGRPFVGDPNTQISAYQSVDINNNPDRRYMTRQCLITLRGNDDKTITIAVEPETGYAHIL